MNPTKKTTTGVILLAAVSLLGIGWVQYQWLQDAVETNRQIFTQKIELASGVIKKSLVSDSGLYAQVVNELHNRQSLSSASGESLRHFMDSVMMNGCGFQSPFTYGIYQHTDISEKDFIKLSGDTDHTQLNLDDCTAHAHNFGWVSFPGLHTDPSISDLSGAVHYHLGLFYPDDTVYLVAAMQETLLMAVIFIILLIGCFSYTIITIRRQKKVSEIKNDFINNLTHEFKTPIFSIDLASGMLKKAPELANAPKLMRYAEVIDNESKRLKSQVDKILQMALIDSGNFKLEKKEIDVHALIYKVIRDFELLIKDRSGELKLNLNAQKTTLFADETHLKNIIYNLLDNAQKYSLNNPHITITTEDTTKGLALSIQDNGIGIQEDIQRFIFNKFYRAETGDVHNVKGFGLGLSYVKSVIEAHQASIQLVSRPNQGSTFTVNFIV